MITKQAIGDYIDACWEANLSAQTIVDQLELYVMNGVHEDQIEEIEILKDGDFNP